MRRIYITIGRLMATHRRREVFFFRLKAGVGAPHRTVDSARGGFLRCAFGHRAAPVWRACGKRSACDFGKC